MIQKSSLCKSSELAVKILDSLEHLGKRSVILETVEIRALLQVFDCGLLGEGILHLLHWAKKSLLVDNAKLVDSEASCHDMKCSQIL